MNGGRGTLPEQKKILISLPEDMLEKVDVIAAEEDISRSEFIRREINRGIEERYKSKIREELKNGYIEMAHINLSIAEMCFEADNDTQLCYEEKLSESEN